MSYRVHLSPGEGSARVLKIDNCFMQWVTCAAAKIAANYSTTIYSSISIEPFGVSAIGNIASMPTARALTDANYLLGP